VVLSASPQDQPDSLDRIARDLVAFKDARGPLSYGELARRVGELRIARGVPAASAYPARTTVYDVFRPGRSRMDPVLVHDIVRALGANDAEAETWVERYHRVRRLTEPAARQRPTPAVDAPAPVERPRLLPAAPTRRRFAPLTLVGCLLLNVVGLVVVQQLHLPLYLDMVGTAVAAIVFGPWYGVAMGLLTNLCGVAVGITGAAPFALVNAVGALVWGYGVRRFGMGGDIVRYFQLNLLVALACSLVGAPLNVLLFAGFSGHGSDTVTLSLETMGLPMVAAAFSTNLLTSVIDKLLTGFIALIVFVWLRGATGVPTTHIPLIDHLRAPLAPRWVLDPGRRRLTLV
jgi:energy-coupling factor transport system substrate-specific component